MKKDGGPAFPTDGNIDYYRKSAGMTLRDWFAGQALVALIGNGHDKQAAVEYAYATAEAMLSEREK